ncbi:MAG: hypothetical protein HOC71_06965 [Candidatus Latescibacteria bacterium]|jgi:uroporphyrinogen decarboxylase|nr:hypothetical protein [Candidatus Latescibacterota bacterium]
MTSRDRVLTALNHEEPDRVPIFMGFTPEAAEKLVRHIKTLKPAPAGFTGKSSDLPFVMEHDLLVADHGIGTSYYARDDDEYTCEWGIGWRWMAFPQGRYTEIVRHPLEDESQLNSYSCPNPLKPSRYDWMRKLVRSYGKTHAIVGGMGSILFEPAWHLRGYETFLSDLLINKDFACELLDKIFDYQLSTGIMLAKLGADILWLGDDFGTQNSLIVSPGIWREFFKERYAVLFSAYKEIKPDIKIAFHSDGNITSLLPEFIETGVDIFQAVQPKSVDPAYLKRKFGNNLSFWGTVDIQEVMPFGTPEDVHHEVKIRIKTVGKNGGFILAPSHNIQPDTPLENILAFYAAARKWGQYPMSLE